MIFQVVPNLTHLKVDTYHVNCDGHRWKELIDTYLPKLKSFYLRMRIKLSNMKNSGKYLDQLLNTIYTAK